MRKYFILSLLLLCCASRLYAQDASLNGTVKEYDDNHKLKSEKTYHNGTLNGPFREYYPNGNLLSVGSYRQYYV